MLNYLKKFAMEILPSVAATIIGAYIVNHYIVTKPGADAPVAAAVSAADPKRAKLTPRMPKSADAKPADAGNLPAAGVKAKGISEKAIMEKTAAERPTVVEKAQEKADAKAIRRLTKPPMRRPRPRAFRPRHTPAPRDKVRVVLPSPVQPVNLPAAPAVAQRPSRRRRLRPLSVSDERRDANDLARAAIERLRGTGDNSPRAPEVARAPEAPHELRRQEFETSRVVTAPALRPLPPPITVSTPARRAARSGFVAGEAALRGQCGARSAPPDAAG